MTMRSALEIVGAGPLAGDVQVHAAKNSALYLILASLLSDEPVVIEGVPKLSDVLVGLEILEHTGVRVAWDGPDVHLHAADVRDTSAPYRLVSKMRASFVVMGALLGRAGEARISMPGGCAFGPRPVDRHIKAFAALGVEVSDDNGDFVARRRGPLSGRVVFEAPTVGGTQNVLLATALGDGVAEIENAALEPEIADLAELLNRMGARIEGAGTPFIRVHGVDRLSGARFRPIPDRIEAGTFMLAAAATRGDVTLRGIRPDHLVAVREKLTEAGVRIVDVARDAWRVDATGELAAVDVTAVEYPGIPTDLPLVVQVSRFDKWKDPQGVIDAFRIARREVDATLVLIGNVATDDPEGQEIFESLCGCREDRIHILSVQDSALVNALQRRAAVVLQKSLREGFGLTVTEAMWKGAPVIGGNVGGIRRQIEDGVNGFLVDSVEEAAERIVAVLKDPDLGRRLGQRARATVRERFLMTRLMEEWMDLIGSFEPVFHLKGGPVL